MKIKTCHQANQLTIKERLLILHLLWKLKKMLNQPEFYIRNQLKLKNLNKFKKIQIILNRGIKQISKSLNKGNSNQNKEKECLNKQKYNKVSLNKVNKTKTHNKIQVVLVNSLNSLNSNNHKIFPINQHQKLKCTLHQLLLPIKKENFIWVNIYISKDKRFFHKDLCNKDISKCSNQH